MRWTQLDPSGQDPGYVLAGDNPVNNGDNLLYRGPLSESSAHCATIGSMKVLILYRPDSEHGRRVEEYIHDFQSRHPAAKLETLNIDTREGSADGDSL
jgi:hypothetical protein